MNKVEVDELFHRSLIKVRNEVIEFRLLHDIWSGYDRHDFLLRSSIKSSIERLIV